MLLLRLPLLLQLLLQITSCNAFVSLHKNPVRNAIQSLHSSATSDKQTSQKKKKHVVIVGGGWAGFSAADALARSNNNNDLQITLLDASPRGKGGLAGGWRTPQGRPVEAGIHGFWREYRNTFAVLDRLGLELDEILTPYTPSLLHSSRGKVAAAPVLKEDSPQDSNSSMQSPFALAQALQSTVMSSGDKKKASDALKPLAALLPVPLDLALLADFSPSSPLNAADRISAVGLLGAWADFGQEDEESWKRYDSISAEELFLEKAGITPTLYEELVLPLLHVLPMCPGYDCSAAAALSCFHVFALQAQGAFDVRWCRGAIGETIFNPWAEQLTAMGVDIRGNSKVASVKKLETGFGLDLEKQTEDLKCDDIIMAVGGTAMGRLAPASPAFDNIDVEFEENRGVTCVAVRMFLNPHSSTTSGLQGGQHDSTEAPPSVAKAMQDSPVVVCGPGIGNLPELKETGFCIYDLQRLHNEFSVTKNENRTAVLEVDFFRADDIAEITDDKEVASLALRTIAATFNTAPISVDDIVDLAVVRARNAVSHFAINSASYSPPVKMSEDGLYMCGDWIDRTGHASWSTEKAVVTGRQAAQALLNDRKLGHKIDIIPAAQDTAPLQALRQGAKVLRRVAPPPGDGVPVSPWSFVKSVLEKRK